jgi:beta-lactamase class A
MVKPLLLLAAALCSLPLAAQIDLLEAKLRARIQKIDDRLNGVLGVAAIDLTNGRTFLYNADTIFPTASTIKVPILIEMFRLNRAGGEFRFSDSLTLTKADSVSGSGHLQEALAKGPVTLTVEDLLNKMIIDSDNTATNKVISMAHMDRVNRLVQELGMRQTRLRRIMMDSAAAVKGNENVTTPLEMARIAESIYRHKAADPADCDGMVAIMKKVPGKIRTAIPADIEVASKTGLLTGVHCEVAIVYGPNKPFVLSVYSTFLDTDENPVGDVAKLFHEYFNNKLGKSNAYGNQVR